MEEGYITSAVGYFWRVVEAGARGELKRLGVLEEISRTPPEGAPDGSIAMVADLAVVEAWRKTCELYQPKQQTANLALSKPVRELDTQLQREISQKPLDVYPRVIGVLSAQMDYALEFHKYHNIKTDGAFRGNMSDFAIKSRLRSVVAYLAAFGGEEYGKAESELNFLRKNQDGASLVGVDIGAQLTKWEQELEAARKPKQEDETGKRRGIFSLFGLRIW